MSIKSRFINYKTASDPVGEVFHELSDRIYKHNLKNLVNPYRLFQQLVISYSKNQISPGLRYIENINTLTKLQITSVLKLFQPGTLYRWIQQEFKNKKFEIFTSDHRFVSQRHTFVAHISPCHFIAGGAYHIVQF